MERRHFLKYLSLATAGFSFSACSENNLFNLQNRIGSGKDSEESAVDFGKLEKTDLTIGFVPTIDCAPLIIAKEQGFFERYGLKVSLSKQNDWEAIEEGLLENRFDASAALFGMPMLAQLASTKVPMISLMVLNLNGSSITLSPKAWKAGIRPSTEYIQFQEFANSYRKYIRGFDEPPQFAIESSSIDNYNCRYWLSTMGINPEKEIELIEISPSQMIYKIQAGMVDSYSVTAPWNLEAVLEKAGFTAFVSRDIWQGHPGKVLATMESWVKENPKTARALVAAVLEACQFCEQVENQPLVTKIISQRKYLNTDVKSIGGSLVGTYNYGGFDGKDRLVAIPDFNLFHFQDTDYLESPNHANYPWRSHGVWLLTQIIRWRQGEQQEYPKDADKLIDKIYPVKIYEDVAKALKIELPSERMKVEPAEVFIDKRQFDPSQPVKYLNSFDIRANRPQIFALG
ncbi:MAG: ABC transporter substrate-binding protein [Symploca sp. SIO2C1]|nr:ABC transporter substrate-binding protein [Symploca sp. SIO2C1]